MLDNYSQVMVEIHHGSKLFLVFNKAVVPYIGLKFIQVQMVNFLESKALVTFSKFSHLVNKKDEFNFSYHWAVNLKRLMRLGMHTI